MQTWQSDLELDTFLSEPHDTDIEAVRQHPGDFLLLGAGGKMGPTLALRVARAITAAGTNQRVHAASRFTDSHAVAALQHDRITLHSIDLLDADQLAALPDCPNVLFLAGRKFGSSDSPDVTWMMNVHLPGLVAKRFASSRIVALSSGNVYPLRPEAGPGCTEADATDPVGEYAQTVRGRERMFEYFARTSGTRSTLVRLNYAVEPRYGVLADIALRILNGDPVDISMSSFNCLWQGDANSIVLRSLALCDSPAKVLNLTGPEILRTADVAQEIGSRLGLPVRFTGTPAKMSFLNDASFCWRHFGPPRVGPAEAIAFTCNWLRSGGRTLNKPTHFEASDGRY
jgi:nucleoside-diphosphate-sugar epimerase